MRNIVIPVLFWAIRAFGAGPNDECYFANLLSDVPTPQEISDSYKAARGDTARSIQFLREKGVMLNVVGVPPSVEGKPARYVPAKSGDNDGFFNHGLFYYGPPENRRALKLISEVPPHSAPFNIDENNAVNRMMVGLQGAKLGEEVSGPKVYRFGEASFGGKRYYYVEMEEMFPGGNPVVLKNLIHAGNETRLLNSKGPSPFPPMAKHFLEAFSKNICPSDADFIIDKDNQVRWLDPFAWQRRDWKMSGITEDRGKVGASFTHFMYRFAKYCPQSAKSFFSEFLKELKHSDRLSNAEKQLLLEELFLSQHHSGAPLKRRLNDYFDFLDLKGHEDPYIRVLRTYQSIP